MIGPSATGPEDIVNDNQKLVLGLIWSYILRYQIGKTKVTYLTLKTPQL